MTLREQIEAILEPTLDRLYRRDLPKGKYTEVAIRASIGMLKSNLTTQILNLASGGDEALTEEEIPYPNYHYTEVGEMEYEITHKQRDAFIQGAKDQRAKSALRHEASEEQVRKEAKQEVWTRYRSGHLTALSIAVEQAKREERERIVRVYTRYREVLSPVELQSTMLDEQALKDLKGMPPGEEARHWWRSPRGE